MEAERVDAVLDAVGGKLFRSCVNALSIKTMIGWQGHAAWMLSAPQKVQAQAGDVMIGR